MEYFLYKLNIIKWVIYMKKLDKLKKQFKFNKKGLLFIFGIAIIGFLSGVIFITIIKNSDKTIVKDYIESYMNTIKNHDINYLDQFKNIFLDNLSFIIIVWLLGMSVIGIPINLFYYFLKSFVLGFTIVSFILTYKIKGCLYALLYVIPHNLINIFIFSILIYYTINFSLTLIYGITKKKSINFKTIINKYLYILFISIGIILLTSLYEAFVLPNIFINLIK